MCKKHCVIKFRHCRWPINPHNLIKLKIGMFLNNLILNSCNDFILKKCNKCALYKSHTPCHDNVIYIFIVVDQTQTSFSNRKGAEPKNISLSSVCDNHIGLMPSFYLSYSTYLVGYPSPKTQGSTAKLCCHPHSSVWVKPLWLPCIDLE